MTWLKTRIEAAPHDIEVLLSDGANIYLGTYDKDTDYFFDQNRFAIPTPRYWHPLPKLDFNQGINSVGKSESTER